MNKHYIAGRKFLDNPNHVLKIMRITLFFLFFYILFSQAANSFSQETEFTLHLKSATIKDVCTELEKKSNYRFIFAGNTGKLITKKVNISADSKNIEEILENITANTELAYRILGNQVVIYHDKTKLQPGEIIENISEQTAQQQKRQISGRVVDAQGGAIIGANIVEAGTTNGTVTDIDGNYSLSVEDNATLQVSYIGYFSQNITTTGRTNFNITLLEDTQALDELVVVGFGTQKKVNLTGSVTTVDSKALAARPINSTIDALQGVVPGLNISTGSGGGALNSNRTFNIRGIGTIGAGSKAVPLVLIDGMEGSITMLNPQDIESISVLKDAAASSIYGSRAPAGVILITTKRGKTGKPVINYNNNFRFTSALNLPEMANSYEFALYFNDAQTSGDTFFEAKLQDIKNYLEGKSTTYMWANSSNKWEVWDDPAILPAANTDWMKTHFGGTHFAQEHSVSVNGGKEEVQYYLSANFLDQGGLLNYGNDNKQRYSVNTRINAQLTKYLSASYNARFVRADYDAPSYMDNTFYHNVSRYWPVVPVKDPNGFYTAESKISQLENGGRYKTQNDIFSQQFNLSFEPIKDWKTNVELNYRSGYEFSHTSRLTTYGYDINKQPYVSDNATSSVTEEANKSNFFNPNIFTEYTKMLRTGHTFKGMLGFQSELFLNRYITAQKDIVQAPDIPTLNTTEKNPQSSGGYGNWATAGFFGRLNYDYDGRYLAELNMRYDGTSRFLEDKRWNLFPSFSVGWNIARETFFEQYTDFISTLKIRGSWGELGNQNTDNWHPFYRTIRYNKNPNGSFALGDWLLGGTRPNIAAESSLVSALLTWERIRTINIGLDINMMRNRFNASFDWFKRQSLDMVGPAPELPAILGIGVPRINNLDMESKGFEITVSWRDQINNFRYGASFNLADSRQLITRYPNPSKTLQTSNNSVFYYPGAYIGDIWGFETKGIAKTEQEMNDHLASLDKGGQNALGRNWTVGDIMYKDLNGDGAINRGEGSVGNPGDQKLIGNSTPRFNFGLNIDGGWKEFDLKIFLQGVMKRDYMPGGMMFWGAFRNKWQTMVYKPHLDYFRNDPNHELGENLDSYYPRLDWSDEKNRQTQTRYLQNAAYCRLQNITFGYTLPKEFSSKLSVHDLRFFLSGENMLTFTKLSKMFDPENLGIGQSDGKTYPLSKTISIGLSLTL
jgi:TonB-linked SusC/RagA family outer membrane protein